MKTQSTQPEEDRPGMMSCGQFRSLLFSGTVTLGPCEHVEIPGPKPMAFVERGCFLNALGMGLIPMTDPYVCHIWCAIYHQYTPVMLAYIPYDWIRHGVYLTLTIERKTTSIETLNASS